MQTPRGQVAGGESRCRARGRRRSGLRRMAGSYRTHADRRPVTGCERFNRFLRLTSGPGFISIFQLFSLTQTLKYEMVTFPWYKIHQTLHRDSLKHKEQLSFLSQLQIPQNCKVKILEQNKF
jgi:hypothetical protein